MGSEHTPGPWDMRDDDKRITVGCGLVEGPNGYDVAEVYNDDCPREVGEANARLIAAAPDLLAALESIRLYANDTLSGRADGPDDRQWQREAVIEMRNRARAAIAKATLKGPSHD